MEEVETTWREVSAEYDILGATTAAPVIRIPAPAVAPEPQTTALAKTGSAVAGVLGGLVGGALGVAGRLFGGRSKGATQTHVETNYTVRDSFNTITSIQNDITINNITINNITTGIPVYFEREYTGNAGMYGAGVYGNEMSAEDIVEVMARVVPGLTPAQRAALLRLPMDELAMLLAVLQKAGAASAPTAQRMGVGLIENVLGLPRTAKARRQPLLTRIGDTFLSQVMGC